MLEEEAAKLALAHAEALGECVDAVGGAIEGSVADQSEGAGDGV